jgi:thioredoxin-like negative regulator of GroEL
MEKVLTLFRTKSSKDGKVLSSLLIEHNVGLDKECIQTVYIEQEAAISTFFGIKVNPTILLFEEGEEVRRYEGVISLPTLQEFIAN